MVCYQEFPDFAYEIPVGHKSFLRRYISSVILRGGFEIPDFDVPKSLPLWVELLERSK
jgi:hypothetical protein